MNPLHLLSCPEIQVHNFRSILIRAVINTYLPRQETKSTDLDSLMPEQDILWITTHEQQPLMIPGRVLLNKVTMLYRNATRASVQGELILSYFLKGLEYFLDYWTVFKISRFITLYFYFFHLEERINRFSLSNRLLREKNTKVWLYFQAFCLT